MNKAVQLGLVVLASCAAAGTQELFSIWGNVTDALTGRPVPDVQVFIPGIGEGAVSVENGRYILQRIPPGEYDLEVGVIGYRHLVDRVRIQGNLRRDFRLDA
ncbi:MAG TPA: carboxypeptidase-like regulatory domain-containing protein, partial [bacterium]